MAGWVSAHRRRMIQALFCVTVVVLSTSLLTHADAEVTAAPVASVQPGTFTGYAFDACTAPPSASMTAWLASPYRGVGIYIGGVNRGCTQAELTATWVDLQRRAGWHLIPLYVGPQASCTKATNKKNLIDDAQAGAQGGAAARDAVTQARALALAPQSVLIYDMEAYRTDDADCRRGVLAFLSAWTATLHDLGYLSGFYSSVTSGVADQVATYATPGYVRPDYLDLARWDQIVTVDDPVVPADLWAPHRRMKQYRGDHMETWGGVKINIDNDYADLAPLPGAQLADQNGNGWSDVVARTSNGGDLHLYPGNGTTVSETGRVKLGGGFGTANTILRIGDLDRDGRPDLVTRTGDGRLWLHPGTATGLAPKRQLAAGFSIMTQLTGVGDLDHDGYPDLVATQINDHSLYLYPGAKGGTLGHRTMIWKRGWERMTELTGVGDFDRDGHPDLVAREAATGDLYLYAGRDGHFAAGPRRIATGFQGVRDLTAAGDFDRDGYVDLVGVRTSDGALTLYRGTGSALLPGVRLATGYGGRSPLV